MGDVLLAADRWPSNGHLIADVLDLYVTDGYIAAADVTWGRGNWWTQTDPDRRFMVFHRHDLKLDGVDFRDLPHPDSSLNLLTLDPPYIAQGGRSTSTEQDFLDRYGLHDVPKTPRLVQQLINDGITEAHRVLAVNGLLLVKCKDYVNGGSLFAATHYTLTHALNTGFHLVDRLEHIGRLGPQPGATKCRTCLGEGVVFCADDDDIGDACEACDGTGARARRVQHARRNLSTLFVFRKTKRARITLPPLPTSTPEAS